MTNYQFLNKKQNYKKGRGGEEEAREYLENKGFILVEANYSCELGEVDMIMAEKGWLVFIEVKYKADDSMGLPEEMIDKRKLGKIRRVAEWYLMENPKMRRDFEKYRIDAVCMLGKEIRHYVNCNQ